MTKRIRWLAAGLPLTAALIVIVGLVVRHRASGGAGVSWEGETSFFPDAASGLPRAGSELVLPPGRTFLYRLKGDIDVGLPLASGAADVPFAARVRDLQVDFLIRVLPPQGGVPTLSIHPKGVKGRAGIGNAGAQGFEVARFGDLQNEFGDIVLFKPPLRGDRLEILVDRRFETTPWMAKGSLGYLRTIADAMCLFPRLSGSGQTSWTDVVSVFDVVRLTFRFEKTSGDRGGFVVEGRPLNLISFLGKPFDLGLEALPSKEGLAKITAEWDPEAGYYRTVRQRVDLGGEKGLARIEASIQHNEWSDSSPDAVRDSDGDRRRFGSWEELRDALTGLDETVSLRQAKTDLKSTTLVVPLLELDALLSGDPDREPQKQFALERLLRTLLESDPSRVQELRTALSSRAYHERTRIQVIQLLSSSRSIVGADGVDEVVLETAKSLTDPDFRRSALICLKSHASDRVVEYLLSLGAAPGIDDQLRNMSLRGILKTSLERQEADRSVRLLGSFYERLGTATAYDPGLVAPFELEYPIVDDFVRKCWSEDSDKKRALKLLAMRSYRDSPASRELTRLFEENLFARVSDRELLEEFVPWAAQAGRKEFFEFVAARAPSPGVRRQAEAYIEILERRRRSQK